MIVTQAMSSFFTPAGVAVIGGLLTAGIALWSLKTTRGLNRAKFLYDLHQDFFIKDTYKKSLLALDEDDGDPTIIAWVKNEEPELIRLLNAFELVAYFVKRGELKDKDADALLGYYLRLCVSHSVLRDYIKRKSRSFEHLDALLTKCY
jgi:hypothetical protein